MMTYERWLAEVYDGQPNMKERKKKLRYQEWLRQKRGSNGNTAPRPEVARAAQAPVQNGQARPQERKPLVKVARPDAGDAPVVNWGRPGRQTCKTEADMATQALVDLVRLAGALASTLMGVLLLPVALLVAAVAREGKVLSRFVAELKAHARSVERLL
jgi:hypothetical protein